MPTLLAGEGTQASSGDNLVTYKSRSVEAMLYDETDFLVNAW